MTEWCVQGYKFHSTLKVLDLELYDMIIGMDWLTTFSPMKVDWQHKWMIIPYGDVQISFQGIVPDTDTCFVIRPFHIAEDGAFTSQLVPPEVQSVLDEFAPLFAKPTELPPWCNCDHTIPLVLGAQPISVRPYRYAPHLKSEIEKQVTEML